jgi:hypothetical protein
MDNTTCPFLALSHDLQNHIYSFLPKIFITILATQPEIEAYNNLCKNHFSLIRSYHHGTAQLINAAFNIQKTYIAFLHKWKDGSWTREHTITIINTKTKDVFRFFSEYDKLNNLSLIAISPQASMIAFIEKDSDTLPPTPCSHCIKVIQHDNKNKKKSHIYCIPQHFKEISYLAFNEKGTKIKIEGTTAFIPEKEQLLPYQLFLLRNKNPNAQEIKTKNYDKKPKLEKYFERRGICKNLILAKEITSQLSLDQK